MKYKGFTITHDSNFIVNGKRDWAVRTEAGGVQSCGSLQEAKDWINENPIDNFVAITVFGEIPTDRYWYKGISTLAEFLKEKGCSCDGGVIKREFKTEAEKAAYEQGIADMDGWMAMTDITYDEYKKIEKYCG